MKSPDKSPDFGVVSGENSLYSMERARISKKDTGSSHDSVLEICFLFIHIHFRMKVSITSLTAGLASLFGAWHSSKNIGGMRGSALSPKLSLKFQDFVILHRVLL